MSSQVACLRPSEAGNDHPVPQAAGQFIFLSRYPCPENNPNSRLETSFPAALALLLSGCGVCAAQELTLKQMDHTAWTARDGAPMGVNSIAEANDGTLWLAIRGGLFNFDGLHFSPFVPAPGEPPFPSIELRSVLIAGDGALWVAP